MFIIRNFIFFYVVIKYDFENTSITLPCVTVVCTMKYLEKSNQYEYIKYKT
jgi:hypothetical protein